MEDSSWRASFLPVDHIGKICETVGEQRLRAMVAGFYRRVREDSLIGPLYPSHDWEGAEKRLADFIVYRFGGPQTYIEQRGHPRLRGRHMPFPIGEAERDRWMELMTDSMAEAGLPADQIPAITDFFGQVADMMRNR